MGAIIPPFSSPTDRGYKFLRVFDQYSIAPGGRLALYVEGGIPNYNWSLTPNEIDYTLQAANITADQSEFGQEAFQLVDNLLTDPNYWEKLSYTLPVTITYDFGENYGAIINKYHIAAGEADNTKMPNSWTLQGSGNGDIWTDLDTQASQTFSLGETKVYSFTNKTPYRYYRLYITAGNDATDMRMYEIDFLGDDFVLEEDTTEEQHNFLLASPEISGDVRVEVTVTDDNSESVTIICCACAITQCCVSAGYAFTGNYTIANPTVPQGRCTQVTSDSVGCPPYKWVDESGKFSIAREFTNGFTNTICNEDQYTETALTLSDSCCSGNMSLSFNDDDTPDTIDPGGYIQLYVNGDRFPLRWHTEGGYSLGAEETWGTENTLFAADFPVAVATVTVTDCGGDTIEFEIRRSTGGWWYRQAGSLDYSDQEYPTCWCSYKAPTWSKIIGGDKWIFNISGMTCLYTFNKERFNSWIRTAGPLVTPLMAPPFGPDLALYDGQEDPTIGACFPDCKAYESQCKYPNPDCTGTWYYHQCVYAYYRWV